MKYRCEWVGADPLMIKYHDEEWGVPLRDDKKLFEFLLLDTMQAGLSWRTVLHKRENYKELFDGFEAERISKYGEEKIAELLGNSGIIRNRLKIAAAVQNAKMFLKVREEFGSFEAYIWQFTGFKTIDGKRGSLKEIPVKTPEAEAMSKALAARGFKFVGATICYAFMQAAGMVNDHETACFRHKNLGGEKVT